MGEPAIEVVLSWGEGAEECVRSTAYVRRGGSFSLGEDAECDATVPAEALGGARFVVIRWDHEPVVIVPPLATARVDGVPTGVGTLALALATVTQLDFGAFHLRVALDHLEDFKVSASYGWGRDMGGLAISAALHLGVLAACALQHPLQEATVRQEQLTVMQHLVAASAAREESKRDPPLERKLPVVADGSVNDRKHDGRRASKEASGSRDAPPAAPQGSGAVERSTGAPAETGHRVNVDDVGGLTASLKRRLSTPLPGGFAHVQDRGGPEASLQYPYPIVSDGRIAKDTIRRVVRAGESRIRTCYRSHRDLAGRMAVTFEIGRSGEVIRAIDSGGDIPDNEVRACIVKTFYGLTFPAPERGSARATYPVHISSDG